MVDNEWTKTEKAILAVLEDGEPHPFPELIAVLPDPLSDIKALHKHVSRIRPRLPAGDAIITQFYRRRRLLRRIRLYRSL